MNTLIAKMIKKTRGYKCSSLVKEKNKTQYPLLFLNEQLG